MDKDTKKKKKKPQTEHIQPKTSEGNDEHHQKDKGRLIK